MHPPYKAVPHLAAFLKERNEVIKDVLAVLKRICVIQECGLVIATHQNSAKFFCEISCHISCEVLGDQAFHPNMYLLCTNAIILLLFCPSWSWTITYIVLIDSLHFTIQELFTYLSFSRSFSIPCASFSMLDGQFHQDRQALKMMHMASKSFC